MRTCPSATTVDTEMASIAPEIPILARDEAFESLYRQYVKDVYHYALALLRNPADAVRAAGGPRRSAPSARPPCRRRSASYSAAAGWWRAAVRSPAPGSSSRPPLLSWRAQSPPASVAPAGTVPWPRLKHTC